MSDSARKYVYRFGDGKADGDKSLKQLLGGKGANLGEMSSIGLPVPPGFTISTEACLHYLKNDGEWPEGLEEEVEEGLDFTEDVMDLEFGDPDDPLLVSVRSGAAVSMPGMMDTVLNLGLNDEVVDGFAEKMGNERIAYDSYRRLIDMYGNVVMGVDRQHFEEALDQYKEEVGAEHDTDLTADDLKELVETYKEIYAQHTGDPFPQDPEEQLRLAINAVFDSWDTPRARKYRKINKITGLLGTAVNVQTMVFGNMGEDSGTGVCFTRNPSTGENELYGEFLVNAQGEDVVAGIRTPQDIQELGDRFPKVYEQLQEVTEKLEEHYKDMEDIEFTVQNKRLFILQTRDGKRTGPAALKIAVDMVDEGLISKKRAVRDMVEPDHLEQLLHPHFEEPESYQDNVLGEGIPASPGAAVGRVVFSADDAEEARERGEQVLLVRTETSPEDVGGMDAAEGILTSRGGMTSHAAVVARGWGKPCVAGCSDISIDYAKAQFTAGDTVVKEGDWISINGTTGEVILGKQPMVEPELGGTFQRYMEWVDQFRTMGVRTNADTGEDAESALNMGAEGIGLCRTEHMFFGDERIRAMRKMILSEDKDARRSALDELVPYQKSDFREIFEAMDGHPVTVRLLDPPLHEFLPGDEKGQQEMAEELGVSTEEVAEKVENLHEMNPMLGHRGCRLGIMYPEITEMQARAILEAASELAAEGVDVEPEIMVPLIGTLEEFQNQKNLIDHTAQLVFDETGEEIDYKVGTMIEVPRAALTAERIAEEADFFSFGTNDLTQMTFGYSRDDAGKWLPHYLDKKILKDEPFEVLDQEGVGQLVARATEDGRSGNPGLKVGICGEHGGEPSSVAFCYDVGLDYVSCSPFRVPIARLAAARAELEAEQQEEETPVGEEVAA